ncbi:MAG: nitrate oxidoreductase subunit beta [Verrucomicrobiae bacterium]|nr:nitrate oxidoreductase subunit beta [Verrucomicrobiae bacterium]
MSQVYNWHLGRDMAYPYEASYPDLQFAFVFNTNRCIGCQSCTMACKSTWTFSAGQEYMWWNNVETKPYGGYPRHWDVKLLDMLHQVNGGPGEWSRASDTRRAPWGEFHGKTIFETAPNAPTENGSQTALGYLPSDEEWNTPNLFEDNPVNARATKKGEYFKSGTEMPSHDAWFFYLARICNHCTYPACLAACPRKAIYKRPEDGIVLIDQKECRGYRKCMEACPYKKTHYRATTRTTEKCIGCYPRIEGKDADAKGRPFTTRCMSACIGQIRLQSFIKLNGDGTWAEERNNPIYYLVHVAKIALPLYPQFGTEPNGFYIPPRWVPRPYLHQMFGPGVDAAIEKYTALDRETLAVLQLFGKDKHICRRYEIREGPKVFEKEIRGRKVEIFNDTIIGYDADGREIVRATVEEPLHVRNAKHANSI